MKKRSVFNSSGGGVAGALDSSYYKGQGQRQGIEREFIVEVLTSSTMNLNDGEDHEDTENDI